MGHADRRGPDARRRRPDDRLRRRDRPRHPLQPPGPARTRRPRGPTPPTIRATPIPTFLDPLVVREPDLRRLWTLPMAVRYLCYRHNPDQTYVKNPDGVAARRPPRQPGARARRRAPARRPEHLHERADRRPGLPGHREGLARGRARPARAERLRDGLPARDRRGRQPVDDPGHLPPAGRLGLDVQGPLPPAPGVRPRPRPDQPRRGAARPRHERGRQRLHGRVGAGPLRGVVHPGARASRSPRATPPATAALAAFDRNGPAFSQTNHDKYRLYVFDETGEGHWDWASSAIVHEGPVARRPPGGTRTTRRPAT